MPAPALDPRVLALAERWAVEDPEPMHRAVLQAELADAAGEGPAAEAARASLVSRFSGPLAFGTAGLRAEEGPGESRMNRLVVRRTAAGLARHLWDELGPDQAAPLVVVGYDARHGSAGFAQDTAAVLTAAGAQVILLPSALPTPVLAFAVRHLSADAGVMVTASHNPPADNGYKVYLGGRMTDEPGRGAQLVSPSDAAIAAAVDHDAWTADIPLAAEGWEVAGPDLLEAYRQDALCVLDPARFPDRDLRVVYTPLHGVGGAVLPGLLQEAGVTDVHVVSEQAEPDPAFPTVAFPNPEEPGAMDLALGLAARVEADLVVANDPDADRLALAVPVPGDDGARTWRMLSGDVVGTLLGAHLLPRLQAQGRAVANSVVSAPQLAALAEAAGVEHHVTLTGFKWISRAPHLGFGYEEALGYCVAPDLVRDKDGMTAALVAVELAAHLKAQGRTLLDALADADAVTGSMPSAQVSLRVADLGIIADVMARLRADGPATLVGEPVTVRRDLAEGEGSLPPTDALLFATGAGTRVLVRPSGTEPKLKCYLGTRDADPAVAAERLERLRAEVTALVGGRADAPARLGRMTDTALPELTNAELAQYIDHTILKADASEDDVRRVVAEAREAGVKSVCVNPVWVPLVREALAGSDVLTCTVIGFPLGASRSVVKAFEAAQAVQDGADEVDMVIDVAAARAGDRTRLEEDVRAVAEAAHAAGPAGSGGALLKVIVETALLDDAAIVLACEAAVAAGADFVKTSTGFSTAGATVEHVALMRRTVGPDIGVKASGGVRSRQDALAMIAAGATRIGASSALAILKAD